LKPFDFEADSGCSFTGSTFRTGVPFVSVGKLVTVFDMPGGGGLGFVSISGAENGLLLDSNFGSNRRLFTR
jgi:hypothetical protein